ncbi:methylated-DNA-protein-cysteine methyltransferase-like protein [Paenibacillus phyllosphaerae]|uniref:Methylated-DNA-protein-cysteine methyltransferase-like protein n=1 Tax=Paenibacillus phyllosphaerae TaxID=274593 RepID=A0A7W5FN01_9BACL|nr:MGMT family protein [Paenibacillus phyllosphaerae]MBB3110785.1 methylated-DNA-protein-cysteine methyltransferase-like protein [Paenibacillus phyllosphaerae]
MQPFTKHVIAIISRIPSGHVMTYGQIAALAGSPRGARQVVRILHTQTRAHKLPWHRVVNAKGEIALQEDLARMDQRMSLESEGVHVTALGTIDLEQYQYWPDPESI